MSWTKKVTVGFYKAETPEEGFFKLFYDNAEAMLSSKNTSGVFDAANLKYLWQLTEKTDIGRNFTGYLFTLVKERRGHPLWFTEDGELRELMPPAGNAVLGDISYGLFCPALKLLLCFAAGSSSAAGFKRMLGQFSTEGAVQVFPLCEGNIDERVLNWDSFKKVSVHMNIPTREEVANFQNTSPGELTKMLGALGGVKLDIAVASPSKDTLSNLMVKDLLTELLTNDYCTSLTVRGSDFENGTPEQFDLKKAQIKYQEALEIEGNYISESQGKMVLLRALSSKSGEIFS